ncbi:MAG TPA: hypothetical protein VF179_26390 [Thermoanaerobaculia bacterium]|nr:hypothetical protein [Thermoanaerobaculia bacterium]
MIWVTLLATAVLNGTFRVAVLVPRYGEGAGHVISTLLLCVLITLLSWAAIGWVHPATAAQAAAVGVLWLALTVVFEFGFGRFVAHKTWAELLADYNVLGGRIWVLVLLTTMAAPYLGARLRGLF